ncbi:ATP-grasp domain-containing protein [Streptomyces sp. NPDC001985]|uniref:ATP-grasp domain-containing protein n=1 Tax=Streptomyces sp. NPDC001985 TaxID=3154406 RepID=UPI003320A187
MTTHTVVLCSRRRALADRLFDSPLLDRVSVVTEEGHSHTFPPGVTVREIGDIQDPTQVLRAVLELDRRQPVGHVVAAVEFSQATGGYVRSVLGLPGTGFETALAFSHKYVMKRRLADAGLPVTRFAQAAGVAEVPGAAERTGWPCVVKPTFGGGCMNVKVFRSPEEFGAFASSPAADGLRAARFPLAVERFVEMEGEYHCDAVVHEGAVVFAAPSRYFAPSLGQLDNVSGSYCLPAAHPDHDPVLKLNSRVLQALGLRSGVTHLELFKTSEGLLVGEVACRPAGAGIVDAVRLQYGVDLHEAFLATSLGRAPEVTQRRRPDIVVNANLPIRPGRITRLVTGGELAALPGTVEVRMLKAVGDTVSTDLTAASATGRVFYTAGDEAEVLARHRLLSDAFYLETSEDGAESG